LGNNGDAPFASIGNGKADPSVLLNAFKDKGLIVSKQLAARSVSTPFSLDVRAILRKYDKNPHSIYLIHLVSSSLNHFRRVHGKSCYDAFDKVF
jgi:hypothetical protein